MEIIELMLEGTNPEEIGNEENNAMISVLVASQTDIRVSLMTLET
jgi:hypothetical protein